jgi:hypothetical protein
MKTFVRLTRTCRKLTLIALTAISSMYATSALADGAPEEPRRHVVAENEIQERIDQRVDQATADREAIQILLQREDVRRIAGAAGLDLERASAAAATLSGPSLEALAAQARSLGAGAGVVGGEQRIVLTSTAIIIILLILILLLN